MNYNHNADDVFGAVGLDEEGRDYSLQLLDSIFERHFARSDDDKRLSFLVEDTEDIISKNPLFLRFILTHFFIVTNQDSVVLGSSDDSEDKEVINEKH